MCFQDFTIISGNVLGVKQGGSVIAFLRLKNRIRGEAHSGSVHANAVWVKPWLHLLTLSHARPVTCRQKQQGKKGQKPSPRLPLVSAQPLLPQLLPRSSEEPL